MSTDNVSSPTAADLMTSSPRTCSAFSSVLEAVMIFRDADCGAVPITDEGKPIGILTDRDVALALPSHPEDLADLPVSAIMTKGVISVRPEATIEELTETFTKNSVRRLIVTDANDQLLGIVAFADISPRFSPKRVGQIVEQIVEQA